MEAEGNGEKRNREAEERGRGGKADHVLTITASFLNLRNLRLME